MSTVFITRHTPLLVQNIDAEQSRDAAFAQQGNDRFKGLGIFCARVKSEPRHVKINSVTSKSRKKSPKSARIDFHQAGNEINHNVLAE